jgi:hypothetical protein
MKCSRCGAEFGLSDVDQEWMQNIGDGRFPCPQCFQWYVVVQVTELDGVPLKKERYMILPEDQIDEP